jgi:class 3 adenylate cyclase
MADLPRGTVTLLFADIEGSTRHVQELGERYQHLLGQQRDILRASIRTHRGFEIDCRADELFACFVSADAALAAAVHAQHGLLAKRSPMRVRMGLHTGAPALAEGAYVGLDVNRAARICAAGHGGQILVSATTEPLLPSGVHTRDLGSYRLNGVIEPERIFEVRTPDLPCGFLPLRAERADPPQTRRRRKQITPADTAWRIREAIGPGPLREPLAALAAALFAADRELQRADVLIGRIDRRRLERHLAAQRATAASNEHAASRATQIDGKLRLLDRLVEERAALAASCSLAADLLERDPTAEMILRLRGRVEAATAALTTATDAAARAHDSLSYKLSRTRWRGVHRLEGLYVVPYADHLGIDRQREFGDVREARHFLYALKVEHDGKRQFRDLESGP